MFIFQLFGHFMSTHVWVDVECPNFFLVQHFSILGLCIFSNFWGYLKRFFSSCLGISCLLMCEWMWNALVFFGDFFLLFQFLGDIWKHFFQLFGHFMSTHVWVDVKCPNFFLVRHFSILGLCIFSNFWGHLETVFPAVWAFHAYSCLSGCECPIF